MNPEHSGSRIVILLPVYNGGDYLAAQIDSIIAQTWPSWLLVCRDDSSSDHSPAILDDYQTRHPERISILSDQDGNLGAAGSFSRLMEYAVANHDVYADRETEREQPVPTAETPPGTQPPATYIALADQDDTWHPDKLRISLEAMQARESQRPGIPLLVHGDLRVVDRQGELMASSFMAYQGLNPARTDLESQLISNTVTGCTTLMNMPLLKQALPIPAEAMMHDWWLSLVASAFGELVFINQPLVEYRQHGGNTIGARQHERLQWNWRLLRRVFRRRDAAAQALLDGSADQAAAFEARFGEHLTLGQRRRICQITQLPRWSLMRQRIWFHWLR